MSGINSKKKGNRFELEMSHIITDKVGVKYFRVGVSSGARATTQDLGNGFRGDIFTEDNNYKDIVIECKAYKEFEVNELFNFKSKIYKFIEQAKTEAKGNLWLLFMKFNNRGTYLIFESLNEPARKILSAICSDDIIIRFNQYTMVKVNGKS